MKLNNKGFTLAELLSVLVILSILMAIMVPSVSYIIEKNKNDNYENLKKGIISAAKMYISDNRYEISLGDGEDLKYCDETTDEEPIDKINDKDITDNKVLVKYLIEGGYLTTNKDGKIINPKNKEEYLDIDNSYITVKYQCSNKNYKYTIVENNPPTNSDSLQWIK